jgi:hypothetical protein
MHHAPCHAALLLLALAACRHAAPARPDAPLAAPVHTEVTPVSTAREAARPAPPPPAADRELLALADETLQRVAGVRRLAVLRPVERGVMNRAQIVARLRARAAEEYPPGEIAREAEVLRRLGMIPEGMDYEATMFALLEEQVAGFYDPGERRLYIAAWVPRAMQAMTLSHEIVHALQDQHFDIARFTHHARGRGDAQLAAMAVVEGDATLAMMEDMLAPMGRSVRQVPDPAVLFQSLNGNDDGPRQARLRAAPRALRESLIFPYREGFALCALQYARPEGFAAVDALLRQPPASTEQVLHLDKLAAREPPVDVPATVPAPLATDHALAYDDVMGEFGARLYLQAALPDPIANDAAAGWGGDRAMLLVPRAGADASAALSESVLVWKLVFDPGPRGRVDGEAAAFERAAARVLTARYPRATARVVPGASHAVETGPGRVALVARAGQSVVVLDRAPADRAEAIVQAVLGGAAR